MIPLTNLFVVVFCIVDLKAILEKCVPKSVGTIKGSFDNCEKCDHKYLVSNTGTERTEAGVIRGPPCTVDSSVVHALDCESVASHLRETLRKSHSFKCINKSKRIVLRESKSDGSEPKVKNVSEKNLLTPSFLNTTLDSSSELENVSSYSSSSPSLPYYHQIEAPNTLATKTSNDRVISGKENKEAEAKTCLQHTDWEASALPIPANNSESVTSVYYDTLESLSPANSPVDSTESETHLLIEQAEAIVTSVLSTVLKTVRLCENVKQYDNSYVNDNTNVSLKHKLEFPPHINNEIDFVASEINIKRQEATVKPSSQHFISDSAKEESVRNWLSASQPSCSPEKLIGVDRSCGSTETRYSQSSPVFIPEVQVSSQNMDSQSEQVPENDDVGDTSVEIPSNIDENGQVQTNSSSTLLSVK